MTPAEMAQIHSAAFHNARAWNVQEFETLIAQNTTVFATDGQAFVLGRVILDEAEILTLACLPEVQRRGHARAALLLFESQLISRGCETIFLDVAEDNESAIRLYQSTGFATISSRPAYFLRKNGDSVSGLVMRKNLIKR